MRTGIDQRPRGALGTSWWFLAAAMLLLPLAQAHGKESEKSQSLPDTWYASSISRTERGALLVHYWSKGPLFRAETMLAGHQIVSIVNREHYYVFDGVSGRGAVIRRHPNAMQEDATRGRSFGMELGELLRQGGEKIRGGSLEKAGVEYELYQVTNKKGRTQVAITLTDPKLPFRVESFIRSTGETSVLEYSGWQKGLKITDSFFEPPAQLELDSFSYEEYITAIGERKVSHAPVYYGHLLHGSRPD